MKELRIKKEMKLRLNKQTVAHLDSRQMAQVGGGVKDTTEEQTTVKCNAYEYAQTEQSVQVCPTCTTHDTGIPPFGEVNRTA